MNTQPAKPTKTARFDLRASDHDRRVIADLARALGVSQSEAIRRAVYQAAEQLRRNQANE